MDLAEFRENYIKRKLDETDLLPDPFSMFSKWFEEVISMGIEDPTAMALSTCGSDGKPSSRMVLLKGLEPEGFVFFSNYQSRKAEALRVNPYASLLFYWKELQCQVRIEGKVSKLTDQESEQYFQSRPLESRVAAVISPQSRVIPDRLWLDSRVGNFLKEFPLGPLAKPDYWGGYLLLPEMFEFWQGRENRMHDRFLYRLKGKQWLIERLAP